MKKLLRISLFAVAAWSTASIARAEDSAAGTWKGQFDSQIGLQKYTFILKVDGDKVTGKAIGEREMGTNEVVITEGKFETKEVPGRTNAIQGDLVYFQGNVFFVEPLKFQDNEIRIEYTGKLSGDEIRFHRKVGDFAEEDFVAKRVKEAEAKTSTGSSDTNAAPARP